jgi:hypothetical protein
MAASSQDNDKIAPAPAPAPAPPPGESRKVSAGDEMNEDDKALAALGYAPVSVGLPARRFGFAMVDVVAREI